MRISIRFMLWNLLTGVLCFGGVPGERIEYLSPSLMELGRVREGQLVAGEIRFVNHGPGPVTIASVRPGCGCTVTRLSSETVAEEDTGRITFELRTEGFQGTVRKNIRIEFASGDIPDKVFDIQVDVYSDIEVSPRFVMFRAVPVNSDTLVTRMLTVRCNGQKPVRITGITCDHPNLRVNPETLEVAPGESRTLTVELKPAERGHSAAYLNLRTSVPDKPSITVPVFVDVR